MFRRLPSTTRLLYYTYRCTCAYKPIYNCYKILHFIVLDLNFFIYYIVTYIICILNLTVDPISSGLLVLNLGHFSLVPSSPPIHWTSPPPVRISFPRTKMLKVQILNNIQITNAINKYTVYEIFLKLNNYTNC